MRSFEGDLLFSVKSIMLGKFPGLVVNDKDSQSEPSWMWVWIPASPKKLDGNDGPLDSRKTNENNKDSQMGQVTPKIKN